MSLIKRRAPSFDAFSAKARPMRQRAMMLAKNSAAAPNGFERTIAERAVPQFLADMADSQSLKGARQSLKGERAAMKTFGRNKKMYTGE